MRRAELAVGIFTCCKNIECVLNAAKISWGFDSAQQRFRRPKRPPRARYGGDMRGYGEKLTKQ
eukprot:1417969-Pleurochrysis_carterae.AAC.1